MGAVILNRVRDSRFPNTIAGVVYQPGAFDAVADGQINLPPSNSAFKAARDALNGWDPSGEQFTTTIHQQLKVNGYGQDQ